MTIESLFSASAREMRPSAIRRMHALVQQRPGIISLAPGQPNLETFPAAAFCELADEVIRKHGASTFQYIVTRGLPALGEAIGSYLARKQIRTTAPELLVTEGSQQGLDLVSRVLLDPGDAVLVELPSYVGAISAFRAARARMVGVRIDQEGVELDHLRYQHATLRAAGTRVKFMYVIPNFQNPSGMSHSLERRRGLLALAEELDLLLVEDDPYGELYFEATPRPTLKSLDTTHRVVYLSSFSKILAPGLRAAFIAGPPELLAKIEIAKQAANLCGSGLDQRIVLRCLVTGIVEQQQHLVRSYYRPKRDALVQALTEHMPAGASWATPEGGMFVWVTLPAHVDAEAMLPAAIESGVAYVTGAPFFVEQPLANTLRLTFASENEAILREGARRLGVATTAAIG